MATTDTPGPSKNGKEGGDEKEDNAMFECNICLETAKDAVVSMCGHLFCWPCLHQWLETRPNRQLCPVCKAAIGKDKVIPLYGRGSTQQEDPRNKVPPRPAGQRIEPENNTGFPGFGFGDGGFHMSFGIGAFPFGFLTQLNSSSTFNHPDQRPSQEEEEDDESEDEEEFDEERDLDEEDEEEHDIFCNARYSEGSIFLSDDGSDVDEASVRSPTMAALDEDSEDDDENYYIYQRKVLEEDKQKDITQSNELGSEEEESQEEESQEEESEEEEEEEYQEEEESDQDSAMSYDADDSTSSSSSIPTITGSSFDDDGIYTEGSEDL